MYLLTYVWYLLYKERFNRIPKKISFCYFIVMEKIEINITVVREIQ